MSEMTVPQPPSWDGRRRGPVTDAEALAVHQRSWVLGLSRRRGEGAGAPVILPDRVPAHADQRQMAAYRLDPRVLAFARARATLEGLTMSQVIDRLLAQYAASPPGTWPTGWGQPDADAVLDPELPGPR